MRLQAFLCGGLTAQNPGLKCIELRPEHIPETADKARSVLQDLLRARLLLWRFGQFQLPKFVALALYVEESHQMVTQRIILLFHADSACKLLIKNDILTESRSILTFLCNLSY